jgi:signal peptidase II
VVILLVSGTVLLLLDQWSKRTVEVRIPNQPATWGRFLRIRRVYHSTNSYRATNARVVLLLFWLAAFLSALVLSRADARFQTRMALTGLGSALGGAAGNLLDIWRRHSVLDFLDLGWWPVFNVADVAITGGILMAFWPRN